MELPKRRNWWQGAIFRTRQLWAKPPIVDEAAKEAQRIADECKSLSTALNAGYQFMGLPGTMGLYQDGRNTSFFAYLVQPDGAAPKPGQKPVIEVPRFGATIKP